MPGKDNGINPRRRGRKTGCCANQGKKGSRRIACGARSICVCPNCGRTLPHQAGASCSSIKCLWCARPMIKG